MGTGLGIVSLRAKWGVCSSDEGHSENVTLAPASERAAQAPAARETSAGRQEAVLYRRIGSWALGRSKGHGSGKRWLGLLTKTKGA